MDPRERKTKTDVERKVSKERKVHGKFGEGKRWKRTNKEDVSVGTICSIVSHWCSYEYNDLIKRKCYYSSQLREHNHYASATL